MRGKEKLRGTYGATEPQIRVSQPPASRYCGIHASTDAAVIGTVVDAIKVLRHARSTFESDPMGRIHGQNGVLRMH
ncbi:hypothetical protein C2E23DRAFT_897144, partial [Lenzites betulinus]